MTFDEYKQIFALHGEDHFYYLQYHYARFLDTKQRLDCSNVTNGRPTRVLDIGAHWLHQSLLYALDGFDVTGSDLPFSLERQCTASLASAYGIALHAYDDLSNPCALAGLPDSHYDVVLFTEIIEHITFNPVNMWQNIYRVLRPGGQIVITTPNYYYWKQIWRSVIRLITGFGVGISIETILKSKTTAPHWKEYSRRELRRYISLLSSDFAMRDLKCVTYPTDGSGWRSVASRLIESMCPGFRRNIYAVVQLQNKIKGITIVPQW